MLASTASTDIVLNICVTTQTFPMFPPFWRDYLNNDDDDDDDDDDYDYDDDDDDDDDTTSTISSSFRFRVYEAIASYIYRLSGDNDKHALENIFLSS
jgi:hypothetical protein